MIHLIQYIAAIIIVILSLAGSALLSLRLHTREEILKPPKKDVQLQNIDDMPLIGKPPKRSLIDLIRRRERTMA